MSLSSASPGQMRVPQPCVFFSGHAIFREELFGGKTKKVEAMEKSMRAQDKLLHRIHVQQVRGEEQAWLRLSS